MLNLLSIQLCRRSPLCHMWLCWVHLFRYFTHCLVWLRFNLLRTLQFLLLLFSLVSKVLAPYMEATLYLCTYCNRNSPRKKSFPVMSSEVVIKLGRSLAFTPSCSNRKVFLRPLSIIGLKECICFCIPFTVTRFLKCQASSLFAITGFDNTTTRRCCGALTVLRW